MTKVRLTCDECGDELTFEAQRPLYHIVEKGKAPAQYLRTLECSCGKLLVAMMKTGNEGY